MVSRTTVTVWSYHRPGSDHRPGRRPHGERLYIADSGGILMAGATLSQGRRDLHRGRETCIIWYFGFFMGETLSCDTGRRFLLFSFARWQHLHAKTDVGTVSTKWSHGCHLKFMRSDRKSCQISSQSDLKLWRLRLFLEEVAQQEKKKNKID